MAERNLNFNEAKSLGLVAPNAIAQRDVLKLAGGESAFKPESWWNQQLKKQINAKDFKKLEGFQERASFGNMSFGGGGGIAQGLFGGSRLVQGPPGVYEPYTTTVEVPSPFFMFGKSTRQVTYDPVFKDVTLNVLKAIKKQSKQAVVAAQRGAGEQTASRKRLSRVTGGLLASASAPAVDSLSTGPMLGGEAELGGQSMLGRRTRI